MSYIHPNIDTAHIKQSAMNAKNLGTLGKMQDKYFFDNMSIEQYAKYIRKIIKEREKSPLWNEVDDVLTKIGIQVEYLKDNTKSIEKFDSRWAQAKLKQMKSELSEADLLKGVSEIKGDCNLCATTIKDLSSLKKVGGTLTLDSASKLTNLFNIEEVAGSIFVHAKNKDQMLGFLDFIEIPLRAFKGKFIPVIKSYL